MPSVVDECKSGVRMELHVAFEVCFSSPFPCFFLLSHEGKNGAHPTWHARTERPPLVCGPLSPRPRDSRMSHRPDDGSRIHNAAHIFPA